MKKRMGRHAETVLLIVLGVLIFLVLGLLLLYAKTGYGSAPSASSELTRQGDEYVLRVRSLRIRQGEDVTAEELAVAETGDGRDISEKIVIEDEKGAVVQGRLSTERTGVYRYTAVLSRGAPRREIRREIILLVDGGKAH